MFIGFNLKILEGYKEKNSYSWFFEPFQNRASFVLGSIAKLYDATAFKKTINIKGYGLSLG